MLKIVKIFDILEDKIRARLSRHPLLYGIISGVGVVMFYRGVWMVMDGYSWLTGWVTLIMATVILLLSGVFVSQFVSNYIILSGLKKEKKLVERVGEQVRTDVETTQEVLITLRRIEEQIKLLKK